MSYLAANPEDRFSRRVAQILIFYTIFEFCVDENGSYASAKRPSVRSGKLSKVREKSVKSQGILKLGLSGNSVFTI